METSSYKFSDLDRIYFVQTRGKLSKNDVTVLSGFILYDKLVMYLVGNHERFCYLQNRVHQLC